MPLWCYWTWTWTWWSHVLIRATYGLYNNKTSKRRRRRKQRHTRRRSVIQSIATFSVCLMILFTQSQSLPISFIINMSITGEKRKTFVHIAPAPDYCQRFLYIFFTRERRDMKIRASERWWSFDLIPCPTRSWQLAAIGPQWTRVTVFYLWSTAATLRYDINSCSRCIV